MKRWNFIYFREKQLLQMTTFSLALAWWMSHIASALQLCFVFAVEIRRFRLNFHPIPLENVHAQAQTLSLTYTL